MKIEQIMCLQTNAIFSIDMHASAQVVEVNSYRHAGDHDEGNQDSWFLELKVFVSQWVNPNAPKSSAWINPDAPTTGCIHVAQNASMQHGFTREVIDQQARDIVSAGMIDLTRYHTVGQ